MAQGKRTINLTELPLECIENLDSMLNMLECLCKQLMGAEISQQQRTTKNKHSNEWKEIWLAPSNILARQKSEALAETYQKRFPKAIVTLGNGLEDSLSFYAFPCLDACKIVSTNMLERLNKEIRRRTRVIVIFPIRNRMCG